MKVYSGPFKHIYDPSSGEINQWYINDHTIIKAPDGWHLFGITHEEPAKPQEEKQCAHAISEDLLNIPFRKLPFSFSCEESRGEHIFWAPHVICHEGIYYMFYCGGSLIDNQYRIMRADSKDLIKWNWSEKNPMLIDGFHARDPMVLRVGGKWLMYYTCTTDPLKGNYCVAAVESDDLLHWSNKKNVFIDEKTGSVGGPCESPFVVNIADWYFLFIGPRGGYVGTDVFASKNPLDFNEKNLAGHIESHAAEVILTDGKYYITHCGWGKGGVYLAPLFFEL